MHAVEEQRHRARADVAARDRLIAYGQAVAGEAALTQLVEQKLRALRVICMRDADLLGLIRDQLFIEVGKGGEGVLAPHSIKGKYNTKARYQSVSSQHYHYYSPKIRKYRNSNVNCDRGFYYLSCLVIKKEVLHEANTTHNLDYLRLSIKRLGTGADSQYRG